MSKETILIVEDERINQMLLEMVMKKNGYNTLLASNGDEGLNQIEENKPDLVLLDVMMPGKNGFEVCSIVKNNPETMKIPIILLTALNAREDINKGIEIGADDFISKPFIEKELIFRVKSLLRMKSLDHFIISQDIFIRDFENMADNLLSTKARLETNIEQYMTKLVESILTPGPMVDRTPQGVYYSLSFSDNTSLGRYFSVVEGRILHEDIIIPIDGESLSLGGVWKDNVLVSKLENTEEEPDEYRKKLPLELVAKAGDVRNFLYYDNKFIKILLVNFHEYIQAFDITMFQHLVALLGTTIKILEHMKKSEEIYQALSNSLSRIAEIRDGSEGKHVRVGKVCGLLCRSMECSDVFISQIQEAVALFDIGKLLIDQSVLLKNGPLNNSELEHIQKVPEFAAVILGDEPRLLAAKEIASGLYEKWDGSGYPYGKKGEEIPLSARMVSLANIYDSLRSIRSYREGYSHSEAVKIISRGDDRVKPEHFDPGMLSAFLSIEKQIEEYYDSMLVDKPDKKVP